MTRFRQHLSRGIVATLSAVTLAGGVGAAVAAPVGPGAPMRTAPVEPTLENIPPQFDTFSCTQGLAGVVRTADGELKPIMITAGHCVMSFPGDPAIGREVYVPLPPGNHLVGYTDETSSPLNENAELVDGFTWADWATVELVPGTPTTRTSQSRDYYGRASGAPVVLTGVRDYRDLNHLEVSFDNAGQPICKDGAVSGRSCGYQLARTQHGIFSWGLDYANGDSGGINFDPNTREALGVTSQGIGPVGRAQPIDSAVQDAYGIPDGQVNEHFQLAESTAPHDEFRPLAADDAAAEQWVRQTYDIPDFVADYHANVAHAQADVASYSNQLSSQAVAGDVDALATTAEQAVTAWEHHASVLPESAMDAAIQTGIETGIEWGLIG